MEEDIFKKHSRKMKTFYIENKDGSKDEFKIAPLLNEDLITFLNISVQFEEAMKGKNPKDEDQMKEVIKSIDKEVWAQMFNLMKKSIRRAYPELDENVLTEFVTANFFKILPAFQEINLEVIV